MPVTAINTNASSRGLLAQLTDTLLQMRSVMAPDTALVITRTGVSAQIGNEQFRLHHQPHELEADLEAVCRLGHRRT